MTPPPITDAFQNTLVYLRRRKLSYTEIAHELNRIGIRAPRGTEWTRDGARTAVDIAMRGKE